MGVLGGGIFLVSCTGSSCVKSGSALPARRAGKPRSRDRLAAPPANAAARRGPSLLRGLCAQGLWGVWRQAGEHRVWQRGRPAPGLQPACVCLALGSRGARPGQEVGCAGRAWEDGGRGREKQSANLQALHRRHRQGGGHAATRHRETEITTTSRGAHAAEGPESSVGRSCLPARVRGEAKPGLSGAGTAAQPLGSLVLSRGVGSPGARAP